MVEDSVKQLVILGNGFDLACGLNSTYDEFFKERFEKVDTDKIIDTLLAHKPNSHGSALNLKVYGLNPVFKKFTDNLNPDENYEVKVNYFDLLFMATNRYTKADKSWSSVEQILQEVLRIMYDQHNSRGFDTNWEIQKRATELKDKYFNNYKFDSDGDKIEFIAFVLHTFNKAVADDDITKGLRHFEETFGKFIANQISDDYLNKVNNKVTNLIDSKADVLSFNYSATPLFDQQLEDNKKINNWYNVHGLSRWGVKYRTIAMNKVNNIAIKLPRPIFGISCYDQDKKEFLSVNDPIRKFTKGNRRDDQIKEDEFDFLNYTISPDINKVTIFGHSLGMTDYDYFKEIFQKLNLANGDLKLEIYCLNTADCHDKVNAIKQMFDEYGHEVSVNADDLYKNLCKENRLAFKYCDEIE